ncbi:MAG: FAD/NAD(P)-binding protein, partial [Trueperaceae bacterium]|nr:FAD/NAD(P)-binding protein [Trueperaceae bacterium]
EPLRFAPGQFDMLYVFGVGEVPISISGDPARPERLVHTTREVGAVTRAMRRLRPGDAIGVRGPFGTSWPVAAAEGRDVVLIAGGIGLPPLRPALYHVLAHRERYGRVVLLYGARTPEDLLFRDELAAWRASFDLEVHVTVDRATGDWRGNVGVCTPLVQRAPIDPRRTVAMICGPEVMIRAACRELARRGVSPQDTFVSLERNMKCAVGLCGHCQLGPYLVCRDGPVFAYDRVERLLDRGEV